MRVAACPRCAEEILTTDVVEVFTAPEGVRMTFGHDCGAEGSVSVSWATYRMLLAMHREVAPPSPVRESEAERIGKMVQGMRIELDVVHDVSDLLLVWDDQERHAPWTIRKEK